MKSQKRKEYMINYNNDQCGMEVLVKIRKSESNRLYIGYLLGKLPTKIINYTNTHEDLIIEEEILVFVPKLHKVFKGSECWCAKKLLEKQNISIEEKTR